MTSTVARTGSRRASGLAPLFAPQGIAVIGASRDPAKLGAALVRSLSGFAAGGGHLAVVNGRDESMYSSIADAAEAGPVDLAMICVPAAACPDVLVDAAAGVGAAVAMPDRELGERVCVYVVPRPGATVTLDEVRDSMEQAGVARFKLSEHLVLVDELPATKVGKIDKKALRVDIADRLAGASA